MQGCNQTKDVYQANIKLALGFSGNPFDTSVINQECDMITIFISIRIYVVRCMSSVARLRPRCGVKHSWIKELKGLAKHL